MKFQDPLIPATLIRRYKRFLADVTLESGETLTVHTPNTGSMLGCAEPGTRIWLRDTANPRRKYRFAWEIASTLSGVPVGINTHLANQLVQEGIETGVITELQGYHLIRREIRYGQQDSRIDLLLDAVDKPACYVEVKNVTAVNDSGAAMFPDAATQRGRKHLQELIDVVRHGQRAVMFFNVQRDDVHEFRPADAIDPEYGQLLRTAVQAGVEALAYCALVNPQEIRLYRTLPVILV